MVDAELNKDNEIVINNEIFAVCPVADASAAARLVRVLPAAVQLVFAILNSVNIMIRELGSLVVEAVSIRDNLLERRRVDLVSDRLAVDRVSHGGVLDLEGPVGVRVKVVAARLLD